MLYNIIMANCPDNYLCIKYSHVIILLIIIGLIMYYKVSNFTPNNIVIELKQDKSNQNNNEMNNQNNQNNENSENNENELLIEPSRKINIKTRGEEKFEQIGILSKKDVSNNTVLPGNNNKSVVIPLIGRKTYINSRRWNYYTATDKYHVVKIPIYVKNKNCLDDLGCDELYDGDIINIPEYNGDFIVKLYNINKLRYIPF